MGSDGEGASRGKAGTVEAGAGPRRVQRLALGRSRRRLSFERRIRVVAWLLGVPGFALGAALLRVLGVSAGSSAVAGCGFVLGWALAVSLLLDQIVRPLQTLANVIAALREDDYSFRARGGRRNDAVGDLALEVNALAAMLQGQRGGAMEAGALLEQVMRAMQSPVLAFAPDGRLRLLNAAAERALGLSRGSVGRVARELGLELLLGAAQDELLALPVAGREREGPGGYGSSRWIVQRSSFRLRGAPHELLVLSDVSAALREEERVAWRRLIRVMGHEINNSLTPIKSIAGSLRGQSMEWDWDGDQGAQAVHREWERGLAVIENRAESLNRFLQAYAQLAGLPAPRRGLVAVGPLLERVCGLETRVGVGLEAGPAVVVKGDGDQLQQALINLVRNAAEAALGGAEGGAEVRVTWQVRGADVVILVRDNGAGIANPGNLFVPFYTTKAEGTGIGLVLALQILEAHGGSVRLRNRGEGVGCEAEVRLGVG